MTIDRPHDSDHAAGLREAFDRSFAQATATDTEPVANVLAIRIGADPYALRLTDVSGLFAGKRITMLPGPVTELLGIAGFRGAILPVYDLAMLLGYARPAAPRWLVTAAAAPAAFAFDGFDGYLSVQEASVMPGPRGQGQDRYLKEMVPTAGLFRPVIFLAAMLEPIQARAAHGVDKERQR